jgi:hypothetical protein
MIQHYPAPPTDPDIVERIRIRVAEGASQVEVIEEMRREGLSIIPSIKLIRQFFGLSANDAKIAVHYSETWSDCRKANDALHDAAFQAAKELGFEEVDRSGAGGMKTALQEAS